ncbi:MAG: hypothetical protein ACQSGP_26375 [Frankia sp.]
MRAADCPQPTDIDRRPSVTRLSGDRRGQRIELDGSTQPPKRSESGAAEGFEAGASLGAGAPGLTGGCRRVRGWTEQPFDRHGQRDTVHLNVAGAKKHGEAVATVSGNQPHLPQRRRQ